MWFAILIQHKNHVLRLLCLFWLYFAKQVGSTEEEQEDNPDLPDGVDVQFNTNKHEGTPVISDDGKCVLKEMKFQTNPDGSKEIDPHSPFGSNTLQWDYYDEAGEKHIEGIIPLTVGRVPFHIRYTTEFDENGKSLKAYGSATLVVDNVTKDQ